MKKMLIIFVCFVMVLLNVPNVALATESGELDESIEIYSEFDYHDPMWVADETLFGQWDSEKEKWVVEPLLDYSFTKDLEEVESLVKEGDYESAKDVLTLYYKEKFLSQPRSYTDVTSISDTIAAEIQFYNLFPSRSSGTKIATVVNRMTFGKNEGWYEVDITHSISAGSDVVGFELVSLRKDNFYIDIYSRDTQNAPYVEAEVNGRTVIFPTVKDAVIRMGENENNNYGSEEIMQLGESTNDSETARVLIGVDFSSLQSGDVITSAKLCLYGKTNHPDGEKEAVIFIPNSETWSEGSVTYVSNKDNIFCFDGERGAVCDEDELEYPNYMILAQRFRTTGNEAYAYHAFRLYLDFIMQVGNKPDYWNNLHMATRLTAIPEILAYLAGSDYFTKEWFIPILKYGWTSANGLMSCWNAQSESTNWGTYQVAGLGNFTFNFMEFADVRKPLTQETNGGRGGWKPCLDIRVNVILSNLVYEDGSAIETPVSYLKESFDNIIEYFEYAEYAGVAEQVEITDEIKSAMNTLGLYMMNITGANFADFQMGDSYSYTHSFKPAIREIAGFTNNPYLLWAGSDGRYGEAPDYTSYVYPKGVRAVLRTGWGKNDTAILFTADGGNKGHAHHDDLSISMFANGQYLLVDGRNMDYETNNPLRCWLISSTGHNQVTVNGISEKSNSTAAKYIVGPKGEDIHLPVGGERGTLNRSELHDKYDFVSLYSPNYRNLVIEDELVADVDYTRSVMFMKSGYVLVNDYLVPQRSGMNNYVQNWHMLPDARITMDSTTGTVKTNVSGANILVVPVKQESSDMLMEIRDGYYSQGKGLCESSDYASYEKNAEGTTTFNTILVPTKSGESVFVSAQQTALDVSGDIAEAISVVQNNETQNTVTYTDYYLLHDNSGKVQRRFGSYATNGSLGLVERDNDRYLSYVIHDADNLTDVKNNIVLVKTLGETTQLSAFFNGTSLEINKDEDTDLKDITVYANNTQITSVSVNGENVIYNQKGGYIYFGDEPIIEIEEEEEDSNTEESNNSSGVHSPSKNPDSSGSSNNSSSGNSGENSSGSGSSGNSSSGNSGGNSSGSGSSGVSSGGSSGGISTGGNSQISIPKLSDNYGAELESHWANKEITYLVDNKIVNGISEDSLGLSDKTTRAQFIAMLVRALGYSETQYQGDFIDVSENDWFAPIVSTAKANGLVEGDGEYFDPNRVITREEMAKILVTAYEKKYGNIEGAQGTADEFSDSAEVSLWAYPYIEKAIKASLINGMSETELIPKGVLTREQAMVVIYRILQIK